MTTVTVRTVALNEVEEFLNWFERYVFTIRHHWYRRDITVGYVDEFYVLPRLEALAWVKVWVASCWRHSVATEFERSIYQS
jgi:hypothetical protein